MYNGHIAFLQLTKKTLCLLKFYKNKCEFDKIISIHYVAGNEPCQDQGSCFFSHF